MFKKIVSNIPYSPSLLPQLSFYAKRIRQENVTRQIGLVFAGLTLLMQFVLVVASPVPSIASADNDLIPGGMRINGADMSHSQAVSKVINDVYGQSGQQNGLKALFEFYGISQQDVQNSSTVYICSKQDANRGCGAEESNNRSIGRKSNPINPAADVRFSVPGRSETFYHRPLSIWDSTSSASKYKALKIEPGLFILYTCGNIVFREVPETEIETTKRITSPTDGDVAPGETMQFELTARNTGNAPAYNVVVADRLNPNLRARTPVPDGGVVLQHNESQQRVEWNIGTLNPGQQVIRRVTVTVVDEPSANIICNRSDVYYTPPSGGSETELSNPVACIDVEEPPEDEVALVCVNGVVVQVTNPGPNVDAAEGPIGRDCSEPEPQPYCQSLTANATSQTITIPTRVVFSATAVGDGLSVTEYEFFVGNDSVQKGSSRQLTYEFTTPNTYTISVVVKFSDGTTTAKQDCQAVIIAAEEPTERVDSSKEARLVTSYEPLEEYTEDRRGSDVNNQKVFAGEIIEYRILVQNSGNTTFENYSLPPEDLRDVLEYANIVNSQGDEVKSRDAYRNPIEILGGGTLEDGVVTWREEPQFTPGEQIEKIFYVVVKDPVPSTNQVASLPYSYDCRIVNSYSNSIVVDVQCPAEKQVEQSVNALPNTGPGESATATIFFGSLGLYLYNRNKQLMRESKIVRKLFSGGLR